MINSVRFGVLTALIMKNNIFCDVTPCRLVNVHRQFGGTCFLHPQDSRVTSYPALQGVTTQKRKSVVHASAERRSRFLTSVNIAELKKVKGKAIPVTGLESPQDCETSRLPHFLDNRLTDCGKTVSLTRRQPFTPQEDSWYSFLLEAESTPGPQCSGKD
jgi:hypothetical protein